MTIHEISRDEYMAGLQSEVQKNGLLDAVKKRLDEINHVALTLNYANWGLVQEMSVEIIDLLKAQEPRVISYDEIENYEVLWLEVLDVNTEDGLAPWVKTKSGHWFSPLLCSDAQPEMILATSDEYGKICRCWTSRPTDKQRKEVKWNG